MTANKNTVWRRIALGAFVVLPGLAPVASGGGSTPDLIWSHSLNGESFFGYTISIGNQGTEVFSDTGIFTRHTRLYSTTSSSPTPVWQVSSSANGYEHRVTSSDLGNIHVVCRQEDSASAGLRDVVVECYDSSSSNLLWSYTFPETTVGGKVNFVQVASDGRWVAAALKSNSAVHLVAFDPIASSSNPNPQVPFKDVSLSFFGGISYFQVSEDLTRAYCGNGGHATAFDLQNGSMLFDKIVFGGMPRGHALSADGKTLVYPRNGGFYVNRDQGAGFVESAHLDPFSGNTTYYPGPSALSDDGRVFIATYDNLQDQRSVHVMAWDLWTGASLLNDVYTSSSSTWSNTIAALELSSSPTQRFALAMSGDSGGSSPELVVYDRASASAPFQVHTSFNRPGSAHEIDISGDGRRLATSGRDVHRSASSGNKVVEAFDLGTDILVRGTPRTGSTVQIDFYPVNSSIALILESALPADPAQATAFGTLYLTRSAIIRRPVGFADGEGKVTLDYSITGLAVGETRYFQGLSTSPTGPPILSKDWTSMTVLP